MELKPDYLINEKTVLFYGERYTNGALYTVVIHEDEKLLVPMSPILLIDRSLISYGSSFKGALRSSRKLLGENKRKYPIKMDASLDIWIFPTKSYKHEDCVWFSLKHIKNTKHQGVKFTIVYLNYNHTFEIIMKESSFRDKRSTAKDLKDIITQNRKNSLTVGESQKGFMIVERKSGYKCKSKSKEKR